MSEFSAELTAMLANYADEIEKTSKEVVDELAASGASDLQSASPRRTGAYASNWIHSSVYKGAEYVGRVHGDKPTYRLAHLLEKGHVQKNPKGEVVGSVAARVHIKPVEKRLKKELKERLVQVISSYRG